MFHGFGLVGVVGIFIYFYLASFIVLGGWQCVEWNRLFVVETHEGWMDGGLAWLDDSIQLEAARLAFLPPYRTHVFISSGESTWWFFFFLPYVLIVRGKRNSY